MSGTITTTNPPFSNRIQEALTDGSAWLYREYQTLASGGTFDAIIQNPSGSGEMLLVSRAIEATGGVTGDIRVNQSIDTSGTAFSKVNLTGQDPEITDGAATVEFGGTYSGGTRRLPIEFPSTGATKGGTGETIYQMQPGSSVEYDLTSDDADNFVEVEFLVAEVTM